MRRASQAGAEGRELDHEVRAEQKLARNVFASRAGEGDVCDRMLRRHVQ